MDMETCSFTRIWSRLLLTRFHIDNNKDADRFKWQKIAMTFLRSDSDPHRRSLVFLQTPESHWSFNCSGLNSSSLQNDRVYGPKHVRIMYTEGQSSAMNHNILEYIQWLQLDGMRCGGKFSTLQRAPKQSELIWVDPVSVEVSLFTANNMNSE